MNKIIKDIEKEFAKSDLPDFKVGDVVRVYAKIKEGDKERTQAFEGIVIAKKGGGISQTFTVRKVFQDVGVERIFPINSPKIEKIKLISTGKARRAKLFYLRKDANKKSVVQEAKSE